MLFILWNDLPTVRREGDQIKGVDLQDGAYRKAEAHVDAAYSPFSIFDPLILTDAPRQE